MGFFLTILSCSAIIVVQLTQWNTLMFESIEIRKAANGFILIVHTEDETKEFVYDTERKLMRSLKSQLGQKITADDQD